MNTAKQWANIMKKESVKGIAPVGMFILIRPPFCVG